MKLSMHSNAEAGVLLIEFDDEGREQLLRDIERTMAEQDHEAETGSSTISITFPGIPMKMRRCI